MASPCIAAITAPATFTTVKIAATAVQILERQIM
jgi:hypothetical protein